MRTTFASAGHSRKELPCKELVWLYSDCDYSDPALERLLYRAAAGDFAQSCPLLIREVARKIETLFDRFHPDGLSLAVLAVDLVRATRSKMDRRGNQRPLLPVRIHAERHDYAAS